MIEGPPVTPLLLRNLIASIFIYAEKSVYNFAEKHKLLQLIRCVTVSCFLFFLRLLLSLNPKTAFNEFYSSYPIYYYKTAATRNDPANDSDSDSAIARALSQLLSIVNDIPVSSRKYQVVRSLAESLIDDNQREGVEALIQVNRAALSAAFSRTISQLEAAAALEQHGGSESESDYRLSRAVRVVRWIGDVARIRGGSAGGLCSGEKLAAEALWLAEKMAACGFSDEAVRRWASATNLARLSISAEPRLQASLVKISALLFMYSKDMEMNEGRDNDERRRDRQRKETKMKMDMLLLWIPLLCRGSNGTEVPVLSMAERAEVERVLEEIIEMLEDEQDQERVLSLWLHHFTYSSSSDWPNLHASYARWCNASRNLFLHS